MLLTRRKHARWTLPGSSLRTSQEHIMESRFSPGQPSTTFAKWLSYSQRSDLVGGVTPRQKKTIGIRIFIPGRMNKHMATASNDRFPKIGWCCTQNDNFCGSAPTPIFKPCPIRRNPLLVGFKIYCWWQEFTATNSWGNWPKLEEKLIGIHRFFFNPQRQI